MENITVNEIVAATGGVLLCGSKDQKIEHLSIDSRTMKGNDLFVPLIGEKVDAHRFIEQAFGTGAVAVLTSEHEAAADADHAWIRVKDTKKALQDIGRFYRSRLHLPLIGITGSVGKTTTREMVAAALSAKYQVYKTPGNSNSQVGVPITLSEITKADEIGVLELGMSMPGELTVIARIAQVDMAVITNVGITHIEQLGSQENIYHEKLTIQDGLKKDGILFLNGDDPLLKDTKARDGRKTVYYGTGENCEYRAEDIRSEDGYPVFTANCRGEKYMVRLNVMGHHNILNAMAALAVADLSKVPLSGAVKSLAAFTGFKNRQQIVTKHDVTFIDDTYNASPVSMKAGLEVLEAKAKGRRIAVLADMKELGTDSPKFHYEVGSWMKSHPVDILFTYGKLAEQIASGAKRAGVKAEYLHFDEDQREALTQAIREKLLPGDCVLLKGSNSMKLGEVAKKLMA